MEKICTGERTKGDVINETVEEYREVYMRTKQQFNTLVTVGAAIDIRNRH
jgi:DNA topoisomerase-3